MSPPQEHSLLTILLDQRKLLCLNCHQTSGNYNALKQALVKRYSTKDCAWVKQRHLVARHQGPNELLSDYINDMHELFSGLNMAGVDRVAYSWKDYCNPLRPKS